MQKISILIADDHALLRQAWTMLLDSDPRFHVVGSCGSGEEALELTGQLKPDIVMMDINLDGLDGFETTQLIRKIYPGSAVIGVSMHAKIVYVQKMLKNGAMGYVTKNSGPLEMTKAIVEVFNNRKYICDEIKHILSMQMADDTEQKRMNLLSMRELEIIDYLKKGSSSKEIAMQLNLSTKTIEVHRHNILKKLNVRNTAALVNHVNSAM
jgi:DNA-binding NarL/FixJ family response regulator